MTANRKATQLVQMLQTLQEIEKLVDRISGKLDAMFAKFAILIDKLEGGNLSAAEENKVLQKLTDARDHLKGVGKDDKTNG